MCCYGIFLDSLINFAVNLQSRRAVEFNMNVVSGEHTYDFPVSHMAPLEDGWKQQ